MNRWIVLTARLLLAAPILGSGVSSLIAPESIGDQGLPWAVAFFDATKATFVWNEIIFFKLLGGLLLVTGLFVPLALVLLAPITLNIFLFELLGQMNPIWIGGFILG